MSDDIEIEDGPYEGPLFDEQLPDGHGASAGQDIAVHDDLALQIARGRPLGDAVVIAAQDEERAELETLRELPAQLAELNAARTAFMTRLTEAAEEDDELPASYYLRQLFANPPIHPITKEMADVILKHDGGHRIGMYLVDNENFWGELVKMKPAEQRERLEQIGENFGFETEPRGEAHRSVTQAPEPIRTVGGGGVAVVQPNRMSQDEFNAWRRQGGGR